MRASSVGRLGGSQATSPCRFRRSRFSSRKTTPPPVAIDRVGARAQVGEDGGLFVAEAGLALGGEDLADGPAVPLFEHRVGIDERPAEPVGNQAADGRLAGPAVADEEQHGGMEVL